MLVRAGSVSELRDVVLARVTVLEAVQRVKTLAVLDELVKPRPVLPRPPSCRDPGRMQNMGSPARHLHPTERPGLRAR